MIKLLWLIPLLMMGGSQEYTVSASLTGSTVTVTWTAPEVHSANDWVGVFKIDAGDVDPGAANWKYLGASTSGSFEFILTATGSYEARLYRNNGYERILSSNTVTVGEVVTPPTPTPPPGGLSSIVYWVEIVTPSGNTIAGLETVGGIHFLELWRNNGLMTEGTSNIKVWEMSISRPDRPADVELTGIVRKPLF